MRVGVGIEVGVGVGVKLLERRLGVLLLLQLQPLLRRPEAARSLHDVTLHAPHLMRAGLG